MVTNHWSEWHRHRKTLLLPSIAVLLIVILSEPVGSYFHVSRFYMLFVPWLVLIVWLPIAIMQSRKIRHELMRERHAMEQRHQAQDELLFGTDRKQ
jgi:hypothetical protein